MDQTNQIDQMNQIDSSRQFCVLAESHRGTLHAELKWVKHWWGSHKISLPGTGYTPV
jgi:hypothetical protein